MAHSDLSRRRSWTAGPDSGSLSASSSQWVRNERYGELKQLEQEAKRSMKEMKLLEIEIREQSAGLEKLKKRDAQRVAEISDLSRVLEVDKTKEEENETEGNGEGGCVAKQASEELQEQLARLKQEHAGTQSMMGDMQVALEHRRSEFDRLAGQHKGLCEEIVKEEKALQAAELEESFQQSVAVQHEMRSLSEDLRRLGHLMEDISPNSLPDQVKQNPAKSHKLRVLHRDPRRGVRSVVRTSHEGTSAPERGWFSSGEHTLPSSSRTKEPVEFEEREGFNRKRHKNSSFEQELERLHEQRERLEIEAHEKQMLLESIARFSSQPRDTKFDLGMSSRKGSISAQAILSPSSVFEGFKDNPSIVPVRPASTESSSASSDISSEDTTVEKPEEGVASSFVKRLNFGHPSSTQIDISSMLQHVGTGNSSISMGEVSECGDDICKDHFSSVSLEGGSVCSSKNVKEQALTTENGLKEECSAEESEIEDLPQVASAVRGFEEEDLTTGSAISEIEKLEEEVGCWEDAGGQEILAYEDRGANEHQAREEAIQDISEEQPLSARCHKIRKSLEMILDLQNVESAEEATAISLDPVASPSQQHPATVATKQGCKPQTAENEDDSPAREGYATNVDVDEDRIWRYNAEAQIKELSSQLSLLHRKVESEVKLQDTMKNQEHVEQSSAATKQLGEQVSFFGDEINELRQSMVQVQQNLLKEVESRSIAEHSVQQFHSICTDQSAKLEHLESQVSHLAKELEEQLKMRADLESKLDKEAQERLKVEAELKDLSQAVTLKAVTTERGDEALGQLVEQQKILLVDQLKEAEKLRTVAEVRVLTLDKQVEQLEMVYDVAQNIQEVWKFQDKLLKFGLQTLIQLVMLALCVSTLYSRVADAFTSPLIPT